MRELSQAPRLLGYVHVRVGSEVVALPVQALPISQDGGASPGGFFMEASSGDCGILVDSDASEGEARKQLDRAIGDAVAHISRRVMN